MMVTSSSSNNPATTKITTSSRNSISNEMMLISEDFFDDFDDDDDAFFSLANNTRGGMEGGVVGGKEKVVFAGSSGAAAASNGSATVSDDGVRREGSNNFGMLTLAYSDVAATSTSSSASRRRRNTSGSVGAGVSSGGNDIHTFDKKDDDEYDDDDITDNVELLELDQRYLSHLRDSNSSYSNVARSCLALHQLVYNPSINHHHSSSSISNDSSVNPSSSQLPLQIESSSIYHIQRYQRLVHRILTALTHCATSHKSTSCRKLALLSLATTARSSYARLRFDAALTCDIRPPSSWDTRLEDECGTEAAHALIVASLQSDDDGVSSTALEALGRLTLDAHSDNLSCEIRSIAECANPSNAFMYHRGDEDVTKSAFFVLEHSFLMKEMQAKIWDRVVVPRMLSVLHRLSLYASMHHVAKALPLVTAALVHAMTHGSETMPSRRAMQMGKVMHGKRGWREVDAEMLSKEYVERILLPCLTNRDGRKWNSGVQRALAVACLRMASACPRTSWRVGACRHAAIVLSSHLHEEMSLVGHSGQSNITVPGLSSQMNESQDSVVSPSLSSSPAIISSPLMTASVPMETLAGTAATLIVALRGVPLHERASGLASVLRATLLFLPHGIPVPSSAGASPDLPLATTAWGEDGREKSFRLGRIGLLTEVALSVMVDGDTNYALPEFSRDRNESAPAVREVLLRCILESDKLSSVWQFFRDKTDFNSQQPVHELLWVFCSVATQLGKKREQLFSKDNASVLEWCNLSLVVLDLFAGIICSQGRSSRSESPYPDASHAAYIGLFADVLRRCGSFPPSALSISENMLPSLLGSVVVDKKSLVVGGPGKQLHHIASSLSKITTRILFLRDKSKNGNTQSMSASIEAISNNVQLAALLVDAWLGRCIMNHDAKQSNVEQLDMAVMFLPICSSELEIILCHDLANADEESEKIALHLGQVLIACLENVACMSELLAHVSAERVKDWSAHNKSVGPLAVTMLKGVVTSAKERAATDAGKNSMIRSKIAIEANHAIVRISECIRNRPQSYPDDVASTFKVSPLLGQDRPRPLFSACPQRVKKVDHCAWFLSCHARLLLTHRTHVAANAVTPTSTATGILARAKLVHPRNALRLTSFSHTTIEMYQKLPNLPLLIPARSSLASRNITETLTGSSDPVSCTLSHGIRRVRKGDLSESVSYIVTMRLHNITPVPIRNGVRLSLRISQEGGRMLDGSMCVVSAVYDTEIAAGNFITWEVTLAKWRASNLILQSDVTFLDLERESTTSKWVSDRGSDDDCAAPGDVIEEEDEAVVDITLPLKPISISPIGALLPCPLVFFAGHNRCESNVGHGDTASFEYLWYCMEKHQCTVPFIFPTDSMQGKSIETLADTKTGFVTLKSSATNGENGRENPITGCAFIALDGSRVFCKHQVDDATSHTLTIRSDSPYLLESVMGAVGSFLKFVFGVDAILVQEST